MYSCSQVKETAASSIAEEEASSQDFLARVIHQAKLSFISGNESAHNFRQTHAETHPETMAFDAGYAFPMIRDECFTRDVSAMPGTQFYATTGPHKTEIANLIKDTLYNPIIPIHHVVAIGTRLAYSSLITQDFYDYCLKEREENFGAYKVHIEKLDGGYEFCGQRCRPLAYCRSQLKVSLLDAEKEPEKTLNVTVIELEDNASFQLTQNTTELNDVFLELCEISRKKPIIVHCAGGVGRTGHLILMLEILKNYDSIFQAEPKARLQNVAQVAKNIHEIVSRLRQNRPAIIFSEQQFMNAILNANILHQYSLKKQLDKKHELPRLSGKNIFTSTSKIDVKRKREECIKLGR